MSSTNAILTGLGLVIVLAIASQIAAERFHVPAIVLLLPVGFTAGAITEDVHPEVIFGDAFQPIVSLGVGLILFEAGLRLSLRELRGGVRGIVLRLISIGTILTLACITVAAKLIFGFGWGVSGVIGAILVVSGPTVVSPLLAFVRPTDTVRSVLKWEGTLIDPIGALLGVIALHAVLQGIAGGRPFHPGELASSLLIGLGVGLAAAVALWLLLRMLERSAPSQGVAAALMVLSVAVVGADLIREDSGLVAAAAMGAALAHQRRHDLTHILTFHGTVVELLIGILFVLISASVTPADASRVLLDGLILVAVMVLLIRPLVAVLGTWRSPLRWRERAFVAWMAPRGIVAAATASAFSLYLAEAGVHGARQILPIVFVAVFATVVLYGLTAPPLARILGVSGQAGHDAGGTVPASRPAKASRQRAGTEVPGCRIGGMPAPVSWLAIRPGWKVYASDGSRIGEVDEVTGDQRRDIFDGISIATSALGRPVYAEGGQVARIEQDAVHLKISREQATGLSEYLEPASSEQIEPENHRGAGESIASELRELEGKIVAPTQRHEHEANLLTRIALLFRRLRGR